MAKPETFFQKTSKAKGKYLNAAKFVFKAFIISACMTEHVKSDEMNMLSCMNKINYNYSTCRNN